MNHSEHLPDMGGIEFFLRGMSYPVTKDQLMAKAMLEAANQATIDSLEQLPDKEWASEDEFIRDFQQSH